MINNTKRRLQMGTVTLFYSLPKSSNDLLENKVAQVQKTKFFRKIENILFI